MPTLINVLALAALVSLAIIAIAYLLNYYPRARAFTTVTTLIFLGVFLSIIAVAFHVSAKTPQVSASLLVGSLMLLWSGNQKLWNRSRVPGITDAEQRRLSADEDHINGY